MDPEDQQILIATDNNTYYTGVSVEPWTDKPAEAKVYADPREAWEDGRKLEAQFTTMLEGSRLELHLRNPDDPEDARRALSLAAENNRPAMRNAWGNEFGQPLPIDMPRAPGDAEQTVRHMTEYLQDVNAPAELPLPDLAAERHGIEPNPEPNELSRGGRDIGSDGDQSPEPQSAAAPPNVAEANTLPPDEPTTIIMPPPSRRDAEGAAHDAVDDANTKGQEPPAERLSEVLARWAEGGPRKDAAEAAPKPDAKPGEQAENEVSEGGRTTAVTPEPAAPKTDPAENEITRGQRVLDDIDAQEVLARAAAARARDPAQAPPPADQPNEVLRGPRDRLTETLDAEIADLRKPAEPKREAATTDATINKDAALPTYVRRHFVHSGDDFYYRNEPTKLAFQAKGETFKAKDPSVAVATALVEMAQSKGWGSIKVKGTDEFKQQVFEAAMERGLKVEGYTPSPGEKAALAERQAPSAKESRTDRPAPTPAPADRPTGTAGTEPKESRMSGVLVSAGAERNRWGDPETNPDGSPVYTVVLRTLGGGLQQHQGADLKRALSEAGANVGDTVELEGVGKRPLVVPTKQYAPGGDGKVDISQGTKTVEVPAWNVTVRQAGTQKSDPSPVEPPSATPRASAFRGVLESHGAAPYKDDPKGSASYYVRLRDAEGQVHAHWGVDLRRAIGESGVKPGDAVQVAREGRQPVTVKVRDVDAEGKVTFPEKTVQREVWSVRPQERDQAAEAVRTLVDRAMPNLPPAARERLMEKVREQQAPEAAPAPAKGAPPKETPKGKAPARATDGRGR